MDIGFFGLVSSCNFKWALFLDVTPWFVQEHARNS